MVEHAAVNRGVRGSSPRRGATYHLSFSLPAEPSAGRPGTSSRPTHNIENGRCGPERWTKLLTPRVVLPIVILVALVQAACSGGARQPEPDGLAPAWTPTATSSPRPTATPRVFPTATPVPPPPYESTRISWEGRQWYLHGANLPWFNWGCDFGCGLSGGASSTEAGEAVSSAIAGAKASGLNVIRWWMFPGKPTQFTVTDDGAPVGIKPAVFQDIEAALRLAQKHDVYFVFVLFSAPTHLPTEWTADAGQRSKLAAVLGTLAERYRDNPRVMAWEVFNEPEWDIWNGKAAKSDVVAAVDAITSEIHRNSPALVTVGSANIEALGMWTDSNLDFYQPHWYDPMGKRACARCTDYASLAATHGLKRPVVIGEFYADSSVDAAQRYVDFYEKGYAGAWGWSLLPGRTQDKLSIDLKAANEFGRTYGDVGPGGR